MATPPTPRPRRSWLLECTLVGALLAGAVYVGGLQTLARRADALDRPLRQAWENFAATNRSSEATAGLPLDRLPEALATLRQTATELTTLRKQLEERLRLPVGVQDQLQTPFQIIDYENERIRLAEDLMKLARARKVTLAPAATNGLPVRAPDTAEPALLWARLAFARDLLLAAIHCQVTAVQELAQLPPVSHRALQDGRRLYEELPMRLEVLGAMEPLSRLLTALPLRGQELESVGLAGVLTNKPPLFLAHVRLRKSAPDRPAEVRAELVVTGLVPLETAGRPVAEPAAPEPGLNP